MTQTNNNNQILSDVNSEIKVIASLVAEILIDEFGSEFIEKLNLARKSLDDYAIQPNYQNLGRPNRYKKIRIDLIFDLIFQKLGRPNLILGRPKKY